MSSKVDMSLEDIITKNKISARGKKTRRGSGRGAMRGGVAGRGGGGRPGGGRGARGGGGRGAPVGRGRGRGARTPSAFRSPRGGSNINGRWSHDMYYGGASAVRALSSGPTKLNITNLDYGVSDSDIKELFSEFGNMKSASVHYDRTGRSLGTAHVIFERRADAMKAIKQYNGVHLDGRPMHIEIDGASGGGVGVGISLGGRGSVMNGSRGGGRSNVKRLQGGPKPIGGGMRGRSPRGRGGMRGGGGGGGRGRGRGGSRRGGGGRGGIKKVPTAEELDAELDEYSIQAPK